MHHSIHPNASEAAIELHDAVAQKLKEQFGDALLRSQIDYDFPVFVIRKSEIHDVLAYLANIDGMGYTYLTTLCGAHFPDNNGEEMMLMYQLHNMQRNHRIRLKVFMSEKDAQVPTATDIYAGANWMEREAFDFYGFKFTGHPDLRRILNMDEMDYHPMRKEYGLEDASRDDKQDKYFGR
mgnify:CR=1 FL=1|jgi:NADH-quinone oxidoreductase subunit C